jgi:hypothetical protein
MFYTETATIKPEFEDLLRRMQLTEITQELIDEPFAENPHTTRMLKFLSENVSSKSITKNPTTEAIDFLWKNPQHIDWDLICYNKGPTIGTLLDMYKISIQWGALSTNESAGNFLSTNFKNINWFFLSCNPSDKALDILEDYPEHISYLSLSGNTNPRAIKLLRNNLHKINWVALSSNPSAMSLLREHQDQIYWSELASNPNPEAFQLMEENIEKMDKFLMGCNPIAIPWLRNNMEYVNWQSICINARTPEAIQFIRENIEEASWEYLSENPYAISILKEFPERITEEALYSQDVIDFHTEYDYRSILAAKHDLHQEYHAWAGHPSMISTKWKEWGFESGFSEEDDDN